MSVDLFFVRPKDPSGATVETVNPFTGEATSVASILALDPGAFADLASRLAPLGFRPDGDGLLLSTKGCRFELTPRDGSAELRSSLDDDAFARVVRAVQLLVQSGYRAVGGDVDSEESEPIADQLTRALGCNARYVKDILEQLGRSVRS